MTEIILFLLLRDGVTIQKLMGHDSQDQIARYDRSPEATRRQAVSVLHVPYKDKGKGKTNHPHPRQIRQEPPQAEVETTTQDP